MKSDYLWRSKVAELGDEAGSAERARKECGRYHCPARGNPLFRGAQQRRRAKNRWRMNWMDRSEGALKQVFSFESLS
jgi:hypothetical protein